MKRVLHIVVGAVCLLAAADPLPLRSQVPLVSGDTSVPTPSQIGGPFDSLVRVGFGPFARLPRLLLGCLGPRHLVDTLVYGVIGASEVDGDLYGTEISFQLVGDSLRGYIRIGEGGLGGPYTLRDLRYDVSADSLRYWYTEGGRDKYHDSVRVTCLDLRGTSVDSIVPGPPDNLAETHTEALALPRAAHQFRASP